jgi:hypothetical protein
MTYQDLVRIAASPSDLRQVAYLARVAILAKSNANFRTNVPKIRAHPELVRVPARVLKKWATRAFRASGVALMRGPVLAMFRARSAPASPVPTSTRCRMADSCHGWSCVFCAACGTVVPCARPGCRSCGEHPEILREATERRARAEVQP